MSTGYEGSLSPPDDMSRISLSSFTIDELKALSSEALINLLAAYGHGCRVSSEMDTRSASIYETGTFSQYGMKYVKIVVTYDPPGALYDYGVRIIIR